MTDTTGEASKAWIGALRPWSFGWIMILWGFASFAGVFGQTLPREVFWSTSDGRGVGRCEAYNPAAVEKGSAAKLDWCTSDQVLGTSLPRDVQSFTGRIDATGIELGHWLEVLSRPDFWLTIALGWSALIIMYAFAKVTGTLRAGLAAAISVVFLGLLLFPATFTVRIPSDMRAELVTAWQWVVIFYFGSEAAVQAWKVSHPDAANIRGDEPVPPRTATPT